MTFTKLFSSITESTVWCEDDQTRIVWITMLAMCNKNGCVFASEPGLANRARVPLPSVLKALERFLAPDPYSRTKEYEGRRIEVIDGGWRLLNHGKHRDRRHEDDRKEYQREWVAQKRKVSTEIVDKVDKSTMSTHTDTDTDTDRKSKARGTRIPEDYVPKDGHYELAKSLMVNCEMEFVKFRDHFLGKSGTDAVKCDWDAAFRNWLRRSINYGSAKQARSISKNQERTQRNREALLAGFGIAQDVGPSSPDNAPGDTARRGPLLAGDVPE